MSFEINTPSSSEKEQRAKRVSDSLTEQSHILFHRFLNPNGRLYGGQLLEWLDELASIVAMRHCEHQVVTAAIDHLDFKDGAILGETIFMKGYITYVGRTSMEVRIDSYKEDRSGMRRPINRAFFVMVAIDEDQHPIPVPGLIVEGWQQQMEYDAGKARQMERKARNNP